MDITNKNFNQEIENITNNLKRCCFVGFDAEFTGLLTGERYKYRLFDTCKERYNQMKNDVGNIIMTQVGLTIFQYNSDQEIYIATGYTFHLCPQVLGKIDQKFMFHASTLKFLCKHNFDYNKFIYEGLPYLNKEEEHVLCNQMKEKILFSELSHSLDIDDERKIQNYSSEVSKWLIANEDNTLYFDVENPVMRYLVHHHIRQRFPDVLTTNSLSNSNKEIQSKICIQYMAFWEDLLNRLNLKILVYRDKNVEGAIGMPEEKLEENLMNHLLGFSHIIELLSRYNKPIIGHNMFLDIILLHKQFIGHIPNSYEKFKKNINRFFPRIYDTKYISHDLAKKLSVDEVWKSNALQNLYEFFVEGKCKRLEKGMNYIKLSTPFNVKQTYHEAGWDSYCSAYCFIRMAHWLACENRGRYLPLGPTDKVLAMAPYCNKVNVIRGAVPYMNLVDQDPPSHRPDLLHVKSMRERIINIGKVTAVLANFGSIDVKPYGSRTALIAASTHNTVEKILKQFKNNQEYRITKFSKLRHSAASRVALLTMELGYTALSTLFDILLDITK